MWMWNGKYNLDLEPLLQKETHQVIIVSNFDSVLNNTLRGAAIIVVNERIVDRCLSTASTELIRSSTKWAKTQSKNVCG